MANNALYEEFNDECGSDSPVKCKSLSRIKAILDFYQIINDKHNENELQKLLVEYIDTNNYKHLLNDYHHLLLKHLNQEKDVDTSSNFEKINDSVCRHVKCDIDKCKFYGRNGRDRENNTENKENNVNKNDEKGLFYMDILDNIHVLFVHSYEAGFRIKSSIYEIGKDEEKKDEKSDEEKELEIDYKDTVMTKLKSHINTKRQQLIKTRGLQRIVQNKFYTNANLNKESLQKSADSSAEEKQLETKDLKEDMPDTGMVGEYCFGHRYYYWSWYKDNNESDDLFNPGYKYKDWYINKKYNDMKQEILNKLSMEQYNIAKNKAVQLLSISDTFKKMKCSTYNGSGTHQVEYEIKKDEPLTYLNLMSLIFYCDYSKLSCEFSKTFRKISKSESDQDMKIRNSEFWHWSKTLMQTVHLYGNQLNGFDEPHISVLYHGVSYMYFAAFHVRFCAPASMTRQISVATIFADWNGIILEIEGESSGSHSYANMRPFYFNCSLLSRFGAEDERLFIGGVGCSGGYMSGDIPDGGLLHFRSIRMMETKQNYFWFVKILSLLNIIVNGKNVENFEEQFKKSESWYLKRTLDLFRKTDIKLDLFKEEKHKTNIIFPEYILICFKKWIKKRSYVRLRSVCFAYNYPSFNAIFPYSEKCVPVLFLFDKILNIFPSCTEIEVNMGAPMSQAMEMPIDPTFISELISILWNISDSKPNNNLNEIRLTSIYHFQLTDFDSFLSMFNKQNWKWKVEKQEMAGRNPFENMSFTIKINYVSQ